MTRLHGEHRHPVGSSLLGQASLAAPASQFRLRGGGGGTTAPHAAVFGQPGVGTGSPGELLGSEPIPVEADLARVPVRRGALGIFVENRSEQIVPGGILAGKFQPERFLDPNHARFAGRRSRCGNGR